MIGKKRRRRIITRELPPVGTRFKRKWKGKYYTAQIVEDKAKPNGKVVKVTGKCYPSMTAAAVSITKQPTNGWRFWKIQKNK